MPAFYFERKDLVVLPHCLVNKATIVTSLCSREARGALEKLESEHYLGNRFRVFLCIPKARGDRLLPKCATAWEKALSRVRAASNWGKSMSSSAWGQRGGEGVVLHAPLLGKTLS